MASFICRYESDAGPVVNSARLTAYLGFEDSRSPTSRAYDALFIPPALRQEILDPQESQGCDLPITPRGAKIYVSNNEFLFLPCPFRARTQRFDSFFDSLRENANSLAVTLEGERVNNSYTFLWFVGSLPEP